MGFGARVVVAIPTTSGARRSMAWLSSVWDLSMPLGSSLGRVWIEDETIAAARNQLCKAALEGGADYVFFLGDDVLPPPNTLLQMLDKIGRTFPTAQGEARADMVSGVYWTKTYPSEPYLWQAPGLKGSYRDWTAGEFFPVDLAGCDCLMISAGVLRGTPEPWFSTEWVWEPGQRPGSMATEDFYFFTKARKHGFRLFADTAIQCRHEDRATGQMFGLTTDMPQAGGSWEATGKRVAEVGSGTESPAWGPGCEVIRFDGDAAVRPDVRCDLLRIPEPYRRTFDIVHARHVLEHFGRAEAPAAVAEWASLLKPGGELVIRVPNLRWAFERLYGAGGTPDQQSYARQQIYGGQGSAYDYHKNGFDAERLEKLLRGSPGLGDVTVAEENEGQNLCGRAVLVAWDGPEAIGPWWEGIASKEAGPAAPDAGPAEPAGAALLAPAGHTNGVQPSPEACALCSLPKGVDGDAIRHTDGLGRPVCAACWRLQLCSACRNPALHFPWVMDDGQFCSWHCLPGHWKKENGENGTAVEPFPREILA